MVERAKLLLRGWRFRTWLRTFRRAEHHEGFAWYEFRREPHLVTREFQVDVVHRSAAGKAQRAPINGDFSAADPKKTAKVGGSSSK